MRRDGFGRRLLAALSDQASPGREPADEFGGGFGRRLLSAMADQRPAGRPRELIAPDRGRPSVLPSRARVRELVSHRAFQRFIIAVILLNAVTLGLETATTGFGSLFHVIDNIALSIFVVELALRIYAFDWRFFADPWSVFDFVVVVLAVMPALSAFTALRAFRVLRVLRLVSAVPAMRRVVGGLLSAIPGMVAVGLLVGLVVYVSGVIATSLFGDIAPAYFGDLDSSLFTLFQVMTGEGWPAVAQAVMPRAPLAWIFFVIYIVVSTFAVLNLFIAVVIGGMQNTLTRDQTDAEDQRAAAQAATDRLLLDEIRALRAEVEALRAESPTVSRRRR